MSDSEIKVLTPSEVDQSNKDYVAEISAMEKAQLKADQAILDQVKPMLSAVDFKDLMAELSDSGYAYEYEIVSAAVGDSWETDHKYQHGYRVVNQTLNGGMAGDEYAGDCYIPVAENQWFKFSYAC